jgi:NAD(P)-dependent dehydrogenase (short-subunit alcohol dehydrogenase family)
MEKTGKIILVTGATGRQGGAAARHLMAAGWQVRAFSRDRNAPATQALHRAGAEIAQGDNNADAALTYDFVNMGGYQADIPALRKLHPGLMDFATWLEKAGKTQLEAWKQPRQMSK